MNTREQLRLNSYACTPEGLIECFRDGRPDECTAVLRIDLERDSKAGRDIVERLVLLADEPRALVGRSKNSAVMLFKCDPEADLIPRVMGDTDRNGIFRMATLDGEVRFTIVCRSKGETVDVSAYSWPKGNAPTDRARDSLPILTASVGEKIIEATFKQMACTWSTLVETPEQMRAREERHAKLRVELARREAMTPDELQHEEDLRLDASMSKDATVWDGTLQALAVMARRRIAARRKAQATT